MDKTSKIREKLPNKSAKEIAKNSFGGFMDKESHSAAEAARILGVSIPTLKRMADDGELESFRTTGGHLRIRAESLKAFQRGEHSQTKPRRAQPSRVLANRQEHVDELVLEAQELRARRALNKLKAEEEAEELSRRDEMEARERQAQLDAEAETRERERIRQEQIIENECRQQQREIAEFHSRWINQATVILSDQKFDWLIGAHRKELLGVVEAEITTQ